MNESTDLNPVLTPEASRRSSLWHHPVLLTASQMRAHEQAAMRHGAVSGLELMERAGRGVVAACLSHWPDLAQTSKQTPNRTPKAALVLAGPGNNGGDGFVVARVLHELGWRVRVVFLGEAQALPDDARTNHASWCARGGVHPFTDLDGGLADFERQHGPFDLCVDGLFGTGLTRPLPEHVRRILREIAARGDPDGSEGPPPSGPSLRRLAIDMPSGLCADSGRILVPDAGPGGPLDVGAPDLTVTFHAPKPGHVLAMGAETCGALSIVDIGLAPNVASPEHLELVTPGPDATACFPDFEKGTTTGTTTGTNRHVSGAVPTHKYGHGHVLCLTGQAGRTGAGRLAARAALRVGAGLVTLGVPDGATPEVAAQITAEMMIGIDTAQDVTRALEDRRFTAIVLGPGLGVERAQPIVHAALSARPQRGVVLDADALTAFADDPDALFRQTHEGCVLTPHGGEFARLFPDLAAKLSAPAAAGPAFSKADAARQAAARAGCAVLFNGVDTVIAGPYGRCAVHAAIGERAAPWLATAGAGDVLAGLIAGLLARGLAPWHATQRATWLHAAAARAFGPGLIASDLPDAVPRVLRGMRG